MAGSITRRGFVGAGAAAPLAGANNKRLALLGGQPVRKAAFPSWPVISGVEEKELLGVLRGGKWFRGYGEQVDRFERAYAKLMGAKHCLATANGTSALFASLNALGVGPGDEVLVPPYTFVATVNVVLLQYALPVFVDTDIETFQMDAGKIEAAVTDRTAAMIPVHLGGGACDMDRILETGRRRKIAVIEDACQAHLGEWKGKRVGTLGETGCFSFQASKNLNSGEGGAMLTEDPEVFERAFAFHSNGRGKRVTSYNFTYGANGANLRLTEFQAALLMAQMTRLEEQAAARDRNAAYLTKMLEGVPGIRVARMYPGCTRNGWHLYMFRYDKTRFAGVERAKFLKAMEAEGIPCSSGYKPLNKEAFLERAVASKAYQRLFPAARLREWRERNECPVNDRLCEEAVWLTQTMLLGSRGDMEQIAEAVRKVAAGAGELARGWAGVRGD